MKLNKCLVLVLAIGIYSQLSAQNVNIIPEPFHLAKGTGNFQFPKSIAINAPTSANEVTDQIATQLRTATGKTVYFSKNNASINLEIIKDEVLGNEGYTLNVNAAGRFVPGDSETIFTSTTLEDTTSCLESLSCPSGKTAELA